MDYNNGIKMAILTFPASGSNEVTYAKQRKKGCQNLMGGTYGKKRKEEKPMAINSPIPNIKKTNPDTCRDSVGCKLKGITNACLNLVILKPSTMDINY